MQTPEELPSDDVPAIGFYVQRHEDMFYLCLGAERLGGIDIGKNDSGIGYVDGINPVLEKILAQAGILDAAYQAGADYLRAKNPNLLIVTNPDGHWI